jgi:sec-independent protein translocase protein TatA
MALDPIEWVMIGAIVIIVFLWGPKKIPEFARSLGRARQEFNQARQEILNPSIVAPTPENSSDQLFIDMAERLGIPTEGKTTEQISEEIVSRTTDKPQS